MPRSVHSQQDTDEAERLACDMEKPDNPPRRRRQRWKAVAAACVVLLALAGLLVYHSIVLQAVAGLLIVNEEPIGSDVDADYVWIRTGDGMSGDGDRCYDWAAKLCERDPSRRVLLSVPPPIRLVQAGGLPGFEETSLRELSARGVPLEAVVTIEGNEHDPWLEARSLEAWLNGKPNASVLLLSSRFGSRRWSHVFDTVLEATHRDRVNIWALADRNCDEMNWHETRSGFKNVFYAYVELAYAWCRGDNAPQWGWQSPDEYERMFLDTVEQAE